MFELIATTNGMGESTKPTKAGFSDAELEGYEEIPRSDWLKTLERGDYIKYIKTNGGKAGSFVNSKSEVKNLLYLIADLYKPEAFNTTIGLDKIDRIYRKTKGVAASSDLQSLARSVAVLSKRVAALEEASTMSANPQLMKLIGETAALEARITTQEFNIRKLGESLKEVIDRINGGAISDDDK